MDYLNHFGRGGLKKKGEIGKKNAYLDFLIFILLYKEDKEFDTKELAYRGIYISYLGA